MLLAPVSDVSQGHWAENLAYNGNRGS